MSKAPNALVINANDVVSVCSVYTTGTVSKSDVPIVIVISYSEDED